MDITEQEIKNSLAIEASQRIMEMREIQQNILDEFSAEMSHLSGTLEQAITADKRTVIALSQCLAEMSRNIKNLLDDINVEILKLASSIHQAEPEIKDAIRTELTRHDTTLTEAVSTTVNKACGDVLSQALQIYQHKTDKSIRLGDNRNSFLSASAKPQVDIVEEKSAAPTQPIKPGK